MCHMKLVRGQSHLPISLSLSGLSTVLDSKLFRLQLYFLLGLSCLGCIEGNQQKDPNKAGKFLVS